MEVGERERQKKDSFFVVMGTKQWNVLEHSRPLDYMYIVMTAHAQNQTREKK